MMKMLSLLCILPLSAISQVSETVIIEQTGKGNSAFFDDHLSEKYNEVTIIQNGNYNGTAFDLNGDGVNDPTSIIIETPASKATIEEYGNYNSALLYQKGGSPTTGSIYQQGNWNCAILHEAEVAHSEVFQYGNKNYADMRQFYEYQTLYAFQSGNKNKLYTLQDIESNLEAKQNGTGNYAFMDAGVFSSMSLDQQGNNNYSEQISRYIDDGDYYFCSVYQNGNNNEAYQNQTRSCEAYIEQLSDGNIASQHQMFTGAFDEPGIYGKIVQSGGNYNEAIQRQTGTRLSCLIVQTGSHNKAESNQN